MPSQHRRRRNAGDRGCFETPWRNSYWFQMPGSDLGHGAVVPELHAAGHRAHSSTVWELVDKQRVSAEQRMDVHDLFDLLIACWM
jgi:hypothetical protein